MHDHIHDDHSGWCLEHFWTLLRPAGLLRCRVAVSCRHARVVVVLRPEPEPSRVVERTDPAINPIPIPQLLFSHGDRFAQCVVTPEYQSTRPDSDSSRASHACVRAIERFVSSRLATHALFLQFHLLCLLVRNPPPQFTRASILLQVLQCSATRTAARPVSGSGVVFLLLASSSRPCYSVRRTKARQGKARQGCVAEPLAPVAPRPS